MLRQHAARTMNGRPRRRRQPTPTQAVPVSRLHNSHGVQHVRGFGGREKSTRSVNRGRPKIHRNSAREECRRMGVCRWLVTTGFVIGFMLATAPAAHTDPFYAAPTSPYPDDELIVTSYDRLDPGEFVVDGSPGIWFLSPTGLNCGIWYQGSFGCAGDIPGAPPGTTHIGWFNGNLVVRDDGGVAFQFPAGQAQQTLPPRSYVTYNGTTCVAMADTSTYCNRGPYRFFVTPTGTWLSPD